VRSCVTGFDWQEVQQKAASKSHAETLEMLSGIPISGASAACQNLAGKQLQGPCLLTQCIMPYLLARAIKKTIP